jgi:hypothetical protein
MMIPPSSRLPRFRLLRAVADRNRKSFTEYDDGIGLGVPEINVRQLPLSF